MTEEMMSPMNTADTDSLRDVIVEMLSSGRIVPEVIDRFGELFSDPGFTAGIKEALADKNREVSFPLEQDAAFGMHVNDGASPVMAGRATFERLMTGFDAFRRKLDGIEFGSVNVFEENRLIDELSTECPGLALPEIILLYNIFKIDKITNGNGTNADSKKSMFPVKILKGVGEKLFLTDDVMFRLNGSTSVHKDVIIKALEQKRSSDRFNPDVLSFLFEERSGRLVEKMKMFLEHIADRRGDDPVEIFNYLGLYIILNDVPDNLFRQINLSPQLNDFLAVKPGEVKHLSLPVNEIYHQAVIYIFNFIYGIAGFIHRISGRYAVAGSEQRSRLVKLADPGRVARFIENTHELSLKILMTYHADIKELLPVLKKFIRTNRNIIRSDDLFYTMPKKDE
jgi:hypothetical protein